MRRLALASLLLLSCGVVATLTPAPTVSPTASPAPTAYIAPVPTEAGGWYCVVVDVLNVRTAPMGGIYPDPIQLGDRRKLISVQRFVIDGTESVWGMVSEHVWIAVEHDGRKLMEKC